MSDYSLRGCDSATSKYFASGEEGLCSPTSPRYLRPGSRHAVSDRSDGDEDYDSTSDRALRRVRRSKRLHGLLEIDTTAARGDMQPANKRIGKVMASHEAFCSRPDQAVGAQSESGLEGFDLWRKRLRVLCNVNA